MKRNGTWAFTLLIPALLAVAGGCGRQDSTASGGQEMTASRADSASQSAADEIPSEVATGSYEGEEEQAVSEGEVVVGQVSDAEQISDAEMVGDSVTAAPTTLAADEAGAAESEAGKESASSTPSSLPTSSDAATTAAAADDLTHAYEAAEADEILFEGWPTPRTVLVFTGRQFGYLEPCGCAGLEHQKGGLVRRYSLLQDLKQKGWNPIPIDAGNQIRRFGRQPGIKFQMTIESLRMMEYRAIAFGPNDLGLPAEELISIAAGDDQNLSPFVSANVVIFDPSFTSAFQVVEANGVKIGITAVLGASNQKKVNNGDVMIRDAAEAITEVWPQLEAKACDFYVLIAHASTGESIALGKQFSQFSVVLTTGGAGEPTRQPEKIPNSETQLIQVGTKGMFAGVVGLFDDPAQPTRYQRVPLDGRFKDTPTMLRILAAYQDRLKEVGFEGLGIRAQRHPSGRKFVGSEVCAECHSAEYDIWKEGLVGEGGPHAKAYHTLLHPPERSHIARNFDPECVSCHVVGWNSQKYFPYESGYVSQEETPDKLDVGCENCHSPGSAHVEAEYEEIELTDEEIENRRQQMVLLLDDAEQKCLECHDLDNSPNFHEKGAFSKYWKKIRH
jgi:hypothetical protein